MTAREFWKCTPRKLAALCQVHAELNDPDSKKKQKTIDGVPVVGVPKTPPGGVGAPTAFIDQI